MSVLTMPEPEGWQSNRRKLVWVAIFAVVACGWLIILGVQATLRGNYLTTVVVVGWVAPILVGFVGIVWASLSPTSLRATVDSTGTTFRGDTRIALLMLVGGLLFIPGAVVYVIFVPQGQIDLPMSRGFQIFSPVLMFCALSIVVRGFVNVIRRRGAGFLRLSPLGIENANVKLTTFTAWNDVVGIGDSAGKRKPKVLALRIEDGREEFIEGLKGYAPGGGLYWMIRHYWLHPDDRVELVDGRALERLRLGRFDVDETDNPRI